MANYCNTCGKKATKNLKVCDVSKLCSQCILKKGNNSQKIELDPGKCLSELTVKDLLDTMDKKFGELETNLTDRFNQMKIELKQEIEKEKLVTVPTVSPS